MTELQQYKWRVKKSERGVSLENFIYKHLGTWSHKQVKKAIDSKRAFVNGKNVFVSKWNLKPNDLVLFVPSKRDLPQMQTDEKRYKYVEVLHEDSQIIVTNKPAFIDYETYVKTVQNYLQRQVRGRSYPYLGQVHRLDKETSGVMVFTKKKAANSLANQFREHRVQKFYLALVHGSVDKEQGSISKAIEKGQFDEGQKVRIAKGNDSGKTAKTLYRVLERYENATLLQVEILTGRTHQIRIHMNSIGHPIVGDKLYGDDKAEQKLSFKRHVLHAERLFFRHPTQGQKMKIIAPLPLDVQKLIDELRLGEK